MLLCLSLGVLGITGAQYDTGVFTAAWIVFALNVLPDYLSLLETRWAIRWIGASGRVLVVVAIDALLTAIISAAGFLAHNFGWAVIMQNTPISEALPLSLALEVVRAMPTVFWAGGFLGPAVFFYSAFLTSVWLWLYAASVGLSRVLLRMNNGVGYLLRVTDVEKQPFRSMGFVSVIIVSGLFALGLPLVLL